MSYQFILSATSRIKKNIKRTKMYIACTGTDHILVCITSSMLCLDWIGAVLGAVLDPLQHCSGGLAVGAVFSDTRRCQWSRWNFQWVGIFTETYQDTTCEGPFEPISGIWRGRRWLYKCQGGRRGPLRNCAGVVVVPMFQHLYCRHQSDCELNSARDTALGPQFPSPATCGGVKRSSIHG